MAKGVPKNYNWVGHYYLRGEFYRLVLANGAELAVWAKMIPMMCVPRRYWFNLSAIGDITGTVPGSGQWQHFRVGCGDMNLSQEDVETDDFTGQEMLDRYMDVGSGVFSGDDGDEETDLGLPGDTELSNARQRRRDFISETKRLGLPKNAVFSDANQITYLDQFNRRGAMPRTTFDMPKFVIAGYTVDIAPSQADWSTAISGNAGGMNDLYRDLLDAFDNTGQITGVTGITSDLGNYLSEGFREAAVIDIDQAMNVRCRGTVEVDVYAIQPGVNNVLTIPR